MSDATYDDGSLVVIDDREKLEELLGLFLDQDGVRGLLGDEEALRAVLGRVVTSTGSDGDVTVSGLLALVEELPEPTWEPDRETLLDSLIAVADEPSWRRRLVTGSPWRPGCELTLSTIGSLHNLERRRVMVFPDGYASYRKGNLEVDVSGRCEIEVDGDMRVSVGPVDASADADTGTDTDGGDAGTLGGVASQVVMGPGRAMLGSRTYFVGGMPSWRLTAPTLHNLSNAPGSTLVPGQTVKLVLR